MDYGSVLVLIDRGRGAPARILAALRIAATCDATLSAVYPRASPAPHYLGVEGVIAPVIAAEAVYAENLAASKEDAEAARATFEALVCKTDVAATWLELGYDTDDDLIACARRHDLVVAPRRLETGSGRGIPAERIALSCGGPVLILPDGAYPATFGRKVLVAWKESRESARVLKDAWRFLSHAEEIHFVTAASEGERRLDDMLQEHLQAHGCPVARLTLDRSSDRPAGETIRQHVDMLGADLVVMGLFGHSRLEELVMGGVSQYLLDHCPMPLLVSH